MQKIYLSIAFILFSVISIAQNNLSTNKIPSQYSKHGITIEDDYVWLENINSDEVIHWVAKQNEFSENHIKEVTKATNFLFKIKDYDHLSTNGLPSKNGKYFYSMYRLDKKNRLFCIIEKNSMICQSN